MIKISASIAKELYKTEIRSSSENALISDEPIDAGGKNLGFSPKELLISALASCTGATLRMYADRKQWKLEEIQTEIELEWDGELKQTTINRKIKLTGDLNEEQKTRLLQIADNCPVHKILSNPINIITTALE